jgi:hypothetical protein
MTEFKKWWNGFTNETRERLIGEKLAKVMWDDVAAELVIMTHHYDRVWELYIQRTKVLDEVEAEKHIFFKRVQSMMKRNDELMGQVKDLMKENHQLHLKTKYSD